MSYLLLDDGFAENRKIAALNPVAFKLHVTGLCYCARHLTDGHLDSKAVKVVAAVVEVRPARWTAELVTASVWKEDAEGDGFWINDYLDYNPSAAQIKEKKLAASRAARARWGDASGNAEGNAERIADGTAESSAESNAKTHPIPSHEERSSNPSLATTRENGLDPNGSGKIELPYFVMLHRTCGGTAAALTKLTRAAKGKPEAAIVNALESCQGKGVRDKLAVALSSLANYGKIPA